MRKSKFAICNDKIPTLQRGFGNLSPSVLDAQLGAKCGIGVGMAPKISSSSALH